MRESHFLLYGVDGPNPVVLHLDPRSRAAAAQSLRWQSIMCQQRSKLAICRKDPNRFVFICSQTGRQFVPTQSFYTEDAWRAFKSKHIH